MNHSLLLSTCSFFSISCTNPNNLKFFKHVANLPWIMNPKKHLHFGHFFIQMWPSEMQLPIFFARPKKRFPSIQTLISCNLQCKFLKFFPHLLKLVHYKILWSHVHKNVFFLKFYTCTRNGSFWWKVKFSLYILQTNGL